MSYIEKFTLKSGIIQLRNKTGECMYFVEGTDRAILIDTACGYEHIREEVEKMTEKPIDVYLTHGHVDHTGGIYHFDKIFVHPGDIEHIYETSSLQQRKDYVKLVSEELAAALTDEDFPPQRKISFVPIFDGDVVDLGNRKFEIIHVPGHTAGSVVFYDEENDIAIVGDACCMRTLLLSTLNGVSLKIYLKSLYKLLRLMDRCKHLYWGHYDGVLTEECVWNVFETVTEIVNGTDAKIPLKFMGERAFTAHKLMPDGLHRADGKVGNMIYCEKLVKE